ncbi:ABC transporter permease [Gryllotalpicola ginsengisoli]|uniref:ABC transporter permease n=1 Tax=Gryllotalpicola ginsengisoli TaxID=444608 RepID=UPI0003B2FF79|nr:ABC transporter permease [Gryllotalpicola ginsengisoli]
MSGNRPGARPFPAWLWAPAGLGAVFVLLPLAAVVVRVDWARFPALIGSTSSLTALRLSLETALMSTALCLLLGVPMALVLARGRFPGRSAARALVLVPLVLPPVVGGLALLYTVGRRGLLGPALAAAGLQVPFSTAAVVLAQSFVSLPFIVISLEGALRSQSDAHDEIALAYGANPTQVLAKVTLPALVPALVSGTVLCFARSLGEFGATITVAGSLEGTTRTLPLEIYLQNNVDPDAAVALSLVLIAVALVVVLVAGRPWARALVGEVQGLLPGPAERPHGGGSSRNSVEA